VLGPRCGPAPDGIEPAWPGSGQAEDRQDQCFEGAHSAHDVLAMCRQGVAAGWPVLRLLRVAAGDEFAQQTVLQVLLPGLLGLSRRACAKATRTCREWVDEDELEHQVVVIALERIRALTCAEEPRYTRRSPDKETRYANGVRCARSVGLRAASSVLLWHVADPGPGGDLRENRSIGPRLLSDSIVAVASV
jgi:hypothetical protein